MSPIVIVIPGWVAWTVLFPIIGIILWNIGRHFRSKWEPISAELNFAGVGKIQLRPSLQDVQIAHRAWVELSTRKAGVPFDDENDVIAEIYDSWYELFGQLRALAKDCPAVKIRHDQSTQDLVWTLTTVLNEGLRPHLTRWQARFRKWYANELDVMPKGMCPQEIQRRYPDYAALVSDIRTVQGGLRDYMDLLRLISVGKSANFG